MMHGLLIPWHLLVSIYNFFFKIIFKLCDAIYTTCAAVILIAMLQIDRAQYLL